MFAEETIDEGQKIYEEICWVYSEAFEKYFRVTFYPYFFQAIAPLDKPFLESRHFIRRPK